MQGLLKIIKFKKMNLYQKIEIGFYIMIFMKMDIYQNQINPLYLTIIKKNLINFSMKKCEDILIILLSLIFSKY